MSRVIVSPSMLSADFSKLADEVVALNNTRCEWIHFDVMDGHFVNNLTFGAPIIKALRNKSDKVFDVHLMMENPMNYLDDFVLCGSDYITIHAECEDAKRLGLDHCLKMIKSKGVKAGIAIQPDTNVAEVISSLSNCDLVLIMSVYAGFGGQNFIPASLSKISLLKDLTKTLANKVLISIDGGINDTTIDEVVNTGADVVISGSYIFNGNYSQRVNSLK